MNEYQTVRLTRGTADLLRRLERQLAAAANTDVTHDAAVRAACTVALHLVDETAAALQADAAEPEEKSA